MPRAAALVGSRVARLYTRPLRRLIPKTSRGFEVIDFAHRVLGVQLLPWQQWLLIHALELLPDGGYRFRVVVVLVARQNGKTTVLKVLALWRLLVDDARLVLGTSTNLDYAREAWEGAVDLAAASPGTAPEFRWPERRTNGEQTLTAVNGARYKIATATRRGGRSLSVDLGIADELREHQTWEAWAALSGTTTARPDPQLWALSNAGDDTSIVLNHFRDAGLAALEPGIDQEDEDLGVFEWSGSKDCDLDDRRAWAHANPGLGHTITERSLRGKLKLPPAVFRTEHLCQRVMSLNSAIDLAAWAASGDRGTLDSVRDRIALCLDVAPDLRHVTVAAAARLEDGRARVEIVDAWESVDAARAALPALLERVKPRMIGWFPGGPGATLAADLRGRNRDGKKQSQRIAGATVVELTADEVPAVCQGFAEQVSGRLVLHPDDPLLTAQVNGASKLYVGDGFRFTRRDVGHVDAVYAAAGAVHLARTLPASIGKPRLVVARREAS